MHRKHAELVRPGSGVFHQNEWAFVGAPCALIESFCVEIADALNPFFKIAYIDADHQAQAEKTPPFPVKIQDKILFKSIDFQTFKSEFDLRFAANYVSAVFVNGNHFQAKSQIVFIHDEKRDSLERKLEKISDPQAFIFTEKGKELYSFLKEKFPEWEKLPHFNERQIDEVVQFFKNKINENLPRVNGLVLAGGKSQRMGRDKGGLVLHEKAQREYTAEMLAPFCDQVFISCRKEQVGEFETGFDLLPDTFIDLGPFGAILSAFRANPNAAWLVVACDLPLLQKETLNQLTAGRNPDKVATAFRTNAEAFPEPLIAIWEPKAYQILLQFLSKGISCPRKVLINSDIESLIPPEPEVLTNVNTPEELESVKSRLHDAAPKH